MARWGTTQIPDQRGRTIVVTGATSGLGFASAKALAAAGARVVMTGRDDGRASAAADRIRAATPAADLEVARLDLADLASVRSFAEALPDRPIDVLLNNAGIMAVPYTLTREGFESQIGTNHLGPFALTGLLLPRLLTAPAPRVVTVSSFMHKPGRIDAHEIETAASSTYSPWRAYCQSKLANLLFAYELDRRARAAGTALLSVAAHPGYAATNLTSVGPQLAGSRLRASVMRAGDRLFAQSAAAGALPELYAATMPDVRGGDYFGPGGPLELRGAPRRTTSSPASYDVRGGTELWTLSERLTGVAVELG